MKTNAGSALPPPKKPSPISRIGSGLLLSVLGVAAALLLLELVARLLPAPYPIDAASTDIHALNYLRCDSPLGWLGLPNFRGVIDSPVFNTQISTNSQGMHDTEHSRQKAPGTQRILMLGDSFVQGLQVPEAETAHQTLEDALNGLGKGRVEVLSGGVLGWSTGQQLVYYRTQGRNFAPDVVLLMFFIGNDLMDNLPGNGATVQGFNCYAPYFAVCNEQLNPAALTYAPGISRLEGNCTPARRLLINVMGWLYQHSVLYRQLEPLLTFNFPRQTYGQGLITPLLALYTPNPQSELECAWQITLATIARFRQEVEADGATFGVVVINPAEVFQLRLQPEATLQKLLAQNPALANIEATRPNDRLAEFFQANGISYIDLMEPMVAAQRETDSPLYLQGDRHWTTAGNRVVAEIVAGWLSRQNMLAR